MSKGMTIDDLPIRAFPGYAFWDFSHARAVTGGMVGFDLRRGLWSIRTPMSRQHRDLYLFRFREPNVSHQIADLSNKGASQIQNEGDSAI